MRVDFKMHWHWIFCTWKHGEKHTSASEWMGVTVVNTLLHAGQNTFSLMINSQMVEKYTILHFLASFVTRQIVNVSNIMEQNYNFEIN